MLKIGRSFVVLLIAGIGCAAAETQRVGPMDLVVRVNKIEIPLVVIGAVDINSSKSDFNANGEIVASSPGAQLASKLILISQGALPLRIPTPYCKLMLNNVSNLGITSQDYEARIHAEMQMSLEDCLIPFSENRLVTIDVAILAAPTTGNRLNWKLLRTPTTTMPSVWSGLTYLTQGDPNILIKTHLQTFLNSQGAIPMPDLKGVRASFQGANFDGDADNISFRVKGDLHTDGKSFTSLIVPLIKLLNLDFTIPFYK